MESKQTPYDEFPYVSEAHPQTHPGRLGALAKLFGMQPAPLGGCRVLELGCASGGNLLPMAAQMPGASFLGIDLSGHQIADGQAVVAKLGLSNTELRHLSIAHADDSLGKFDYIIAHGVFSWVPRETQEKVLSICKENLAPNGVAYVSYNAYPGWHMRGMVRDMMLYHARHFREPSLQVQQARAFLDFLAQSVPTDNNPWGILLKLELEALRNVGDAYLAHDQLEQVNEPVYFHEFAQRAASHGLQYLAEADVSSMFAFDLPPQVTKTLRKIAPGIVRMEQYMDFVRNRVFRQTLLVHEGVPLNRKLNARDIWRDMKGLYVASAARPVATGSDVRSVGMERFRAPSGAVLDTPHPLVKAAMVTLAEQWPQGMLFDDLCLAARRRLNSAPDSGSDVPIADDDAQTLGAELLRCFAAAIVELRLGTPQLSKLVANCPKGSALARLQAEKGTHVTNLRHEGVNLDEFSRQVLGYLDGSRDRTALLEILEGLVDKGVLSIRQEDRTAHEKAGFRQSLSRVLDQNLLKLAQASLLEA